MKSWVLILVLALAAPVAASTASGSSSVGKCGLGASAVSNASGGQGGASKATAYNGPVSANAAGYWLPEVWRPNAWVTPWSPVVLPAEAVAPVVSTLPRIPEEKEVSFWYNGTKYVLE